MKDGPLWLQVGTLLDGVSSAPARDVHLVYDAQTIRFVGSSGQRPPRQVLREGQQAPTVILDTCTALPLLVEAHGHLFLEGQPLDPEIRKQNLELPVAALTERARARLPILMALGVGVVRDAGDRHGVAVALRDQSPARGLPLLDCAGAAIHRRGRYGAFMGGAFEEHDSAAACVEARCQAGGDRIKVVVSGIIDFKLGRVTAAPQMSRADVAAIVAAARARGKQTMAHASGEAGIENTIEGGADSLEHGFFITPAQLRRLLDNAVAWAPTFMPVFAQRDRAIEAGWDAQTVGHLDRILDQHRIAVREAHQLGVVLLAGSDAGSGGVPHGLGLLKELELMEAAGVPSLSVINAATGVGAAALKLRERACRLVAGAPARLMITARSPLDSVANLRKERAVIVDGAVLDGLVDPDPSGL